MAGVSLSQKHDGVSFARLVADPAGPPTREHVICETFRYPRPGGNGLYIPPERYKPNIDSINVSVRTEEGKYVYRHRDIEEYYDYRTDPLENHNIFEEAEKDGRVAPLRELILALLEDSPKLHAAVAENMRTGEARKAGLAAAPPENEE